MTRRREQRVEVESFSGEATLMETVINGSNSTVTRQKQEQEALSHLLEEITLLLSKWDGLQMAVQNQWGGRDSLQKSHQLAVDILSWFSQSKAPLYVEDLETLLHESILLSLNTEIEDGSIEEVAERLIIMHEEYLHLQGYH